MRWDARGTIALLVSALVGVTAGVVVGFTTGGPGPSPAGNDPSVSPTPSGSFDDPLGLGVPLENLPCTEDTILVVGSGDTRGELDNAVTANPETEVKYLETASSCNTLYGAERQDPPKYAAYMGPFDTPAEPCQLQMSVDHTNDVVTSLKPGTKIHVPCLCVLRLNTENFPELAVGMEATTRDGIFIFALQRLLVDIEMATNRQVTGHYGLATQKVIVELQELNALDAEPGVVDLQTWRMLRDRACLQYDY